MIYFRSSILLFQHYILQYLLMMKLPNSKAASILTWRWLYAGSSRGSTSSMYPDFPSISNDSLLLRHNHSVSPFLPNFTPMMCHKMSSYFPHGTSMKYPHQVPPQCFHHVPMFVSMTSPCACLSIWPLGFVKMPVELGHRNSELFHEKLWFSIAVLVDQRVSMG